RCGAFKIDPVHQMFHPIISLRDRVGIESIGFDNVCSRLQILVMDILYNIGSGNVEQIIVPLYIRWIILEFLSPKIAFPESVILNHGSHGTVQYDDSLI